MPEGTNINTPDYKEKQKLLYIEKTPPDTLIHLGDVCLESGKITDAIEFYARADHRPGLEKIRDLVIERGDVMDFQGVLRALRLAGSPDEWNRIGQRAFELKKYTFALHAFEKSGNLEMREKVHQLISQKDQSNK